MPLKTQCPLCKKVSYGWGDRCECGMPVKGVHIVNRIEPDHDLEYHDKKLEGR